jgi:hypothetical protein
MRNYEHKKLAENITRIDAVPVGRRDFVDWLEAKAHLDLLRKNAEHDEIIVNALSDHTFITSLLVDNGHLTPLDEADLLDWNLASPRSLAGYATGGRDEDVWIESGLTGTGTTSLENAKQLTFRRTFEGWKGPGRTYYEADQEFAHICDIHWRPELRAYCRFDGRGDVEQVITVTSRDDNDCAVELVSCRWQSLEEYLAVSNRSLVRLFDFTLLGPNFTHWPSVQPDIVRETSALFYRRQIHSGIASYTRGIQIVRPRRDPRALRSDLRSSWFSSERRDYAEFVAYDWRNDRVARISTDPSATTNYFDASTNSLPYEISPAFFRPEVLLKYKGDRDKYTVEDRSISCRTAWRLKAFDVNEAGQVHAYLAYLRHLPYEEQLHWLSFNEAPRAKISQRAFTHDFEGAFVSFENPLSEIRAILRRWQDERAEWWTLRDDSLFERISIPITESRDEWSDAFMDLSKLVVEGMELKPIRRRLSELQVDFKVDERTISLLEKLLGKTCGAGASQDLAGLRTTQLLRTKLKGHVGGSEGHELARTAIAEHHTFAAHFNHVCRLVKDDLGKIEGCWSNEE